MTLMIIGWYVLCCVLAYGCFYLADHNINKNKFLISWRWDALDTIMFGIVSLGGPISMIVALIMLTFEFEG